MYTMDHPCTCDVLVVGLASVSSIIRDPQPLIQTETLLICHAHSRSCLIPQNTAHVKCLFCAKVVSLTNRQRKWYKLRSSSSAAQVLPTHPTHFSVKCRHAGVTPITHGIIWWSSIIKLASVIELLLRSETICYLVVMFSFYCFHGYNPNEN